METPNTCGLSPASGYSPVLLVFCCYLCQGYRDLFLREPCPVDEGRDLFDEYRGLLRVPWPCFEGAVTCLKVPWPLEGTVALFWGCHVLLGGAVTCLNEPLSILVDTAAYSASSSALFAVRVRFPVVGVSVSPCVLTVVAWKKPIYRWLEILYRSEPSFNWA